MPNNTGILVPDAIRPFNSSDTFPVAYANEIKGGFHIVADISKRDAITIPRRLEGMLCYVTSEKTVYQLIDGIDNSNWSEFLTGGETYVEKYVAQGDLLVKNDLVTFNEGYAEKITEWTELISVAGIVLEDEDESRSVSICVGGIAKNLTDIESGQEYYVNPTNGQLTADSTLNGEFIGFGISSTELFFIPLWDKKLHNSKLNLKVDKVEGKALSTNDFTDDYKEILDNFNTTTIFDGGNASSN